MKKIALAVLAVVAMGAQAADEGVYGGLTYNHAKASGNWSGSENAAGFLVTSQGKCHAFRKPATEPSMYS